MNNAYEIRNVLFYESQTRHWKWLRYVCRLKIKFPEGPVETSWDEGSVEGREDGRRREMTLCSYNPKSEDEEGRGSLVVARDMFENARRKVRDGIDGIVA